MNESEFKEKWTLDKPVYNAWGKYVVGTISQALESKGKNLDDFLKVPAKYRLKDDDSLIDKAFYRPDKKYSDPYEKIEDKVGVRFIVLFVDDIKVIDEIIRGIDDWTFDACKHFDEDKRKDPLLFTYQSVHYILKPKKEIEYENIKIPPSVPCEVQIRTLLQHAHAELTHDAIYKTKITVRPEVLRTVAKSMALIETTDEFFTSVTQQLNYGPLQEHGISERLDGLYYSFTGIKAHAQKSSIAIWSTFELYIDENLIGEIQNLINGNAFLSDKIKERYTNHTFYHQSTVLFVYWMLKKKKNRLLRDWPLPKELLQLFSVDIGISISDH